MLAVPLKPSREVVGNVAVAGLLGTVTFVPVPAAPYVIVRWSPVPHVIGTVMVHGPEPEIDVEPGSQVFVPLPAPSATVRNPGLVELLVCGAVQPDGTCSVICELDAKLEPPSL